jgi:hypothetical protein
MELRYFQFEMLMAADKKFRSDAGDVGPFFDVVSYFDGDLWNVMVTFFKGFCLALVD